MVSSIPIYRAKLYDMMLPCLLCETLQYSCKCILTLHSLVIRHQGEKEWDGLGVQYSTLQCDIAEILPDIQNLIEVDNNMWCVVYGRECIYMYVSCTHRHRCGSRLHMIAIR